MGEMGSCSKKKKNFQKPKDVLWPRGQTASTCVKPTRCSGRQEHEEESDQTNSRSHRNRGSDQKVLDEQELQSHLLVPSLLYHISYNSATHCYIPFFDPLFPCLPTTFIPFCTYYSCTSKTLLLCQLVLNYNRFMYSPQRLSPTV